MLPHLAKFRFAIFSANILLRIPSKTIKPTLCGYSMRLKLAGAKKIRSKFA